MDKRDAPKARPQTGQDTMSTSYKCWDYRLTKGGSEFNRYTEKQAPRKEG